MPNCQGICFAVKNQGVTSSPTAYIRSRPLFTMMSDKSLSLKEYIRNSDVPAFSR